MSRPRRLRRGLKETLVKAKRHFFKRHRSVTDSGPTVPPSSQITMTSVGKGTLPGTVAVTPPTPPPSLQARTQPAAASDSTATHGNIDTGADATEKQEQLPSGTISAQDLRKDESRATKLQNVPGNEIAPQLVQSLDTGRIPEKPVKFLAVKDPAMIATAPTPLEKPMTPDGPPTSITSAASPAPAQHNGMESRLGSTTQTANLIPQRGDTATKSAMSSSQGAAITQPPAAALQVVPSVGSPAGPVMAAAEPTASGSPWYSKRTPIWNDAVKLWKAENPEGCLELETMTAGMKSLVQGADFLSQFQPASKSSKQIAARLKRWQPTLAAVRGIGRSVAALDPHKIAPIICASVFFSIDVSNPSSLRIRLTKADSF